MTSLYAKYLQCLGMCVLYLLLHITVSKELVPMGPEAVQWRQSQNKEVPC